MPALQPAPAYPETGSVNRRADLVHDGGATVKRKDRPGDVGHRGFGGEYGHSGWQVQIGCFVGGRSARLEDLDDIATGDRLGQSSGGIVSIVAGGGVRRDCHHIRIGGGRFSGSPGHQGGCPVSSPS